MAHVWTLQAAAETPASCMQAAGVQQRMQLGTSLFHAHKAHVCSDACSLHISGTTHRAAVQLLGHRSVAAVVYDGMVQIVAPRCKEHVQSGVWDMPF